MKLFLSYGHDHNAPLVERIRADLVAAGHEIWIDTSQIKAGDDWRRSIFDGLADTDWVLGFLSKHSTRDPGVCLDELSIALHMKSGAIATVLVEGEAAADPPVTVSHIQWLDMHDWQNQLNGVAGEAWYRQRFGEILSMLENPLTRRFAGEIKELEARLIPVSQIADVGALIDRFVGRQWLRDAIDVWRNSAGDSRLLWVSGGAGTGKSAFAAWLGHMGRVNVIGLNLCSYNKDDRRDASRVIRTLAFQIATRLPDYRRLILDRLQIQDPDGTALAHKRPAAIFNFLIIEPLRMAIDGGRSAHRHLIVIDGLDETVHEGRSELTEVLAAEAGKLPPWMAMLVTSRPEEPILRQFAGLQPVTINAESPENIDDLRIYARAWLAAETIAGRLDPAIDRVVAASEGNFLYLRMLRDAVAAGTMNLDAPEGLPHGLAGLYERWFRHRFPNDAAYELYVPALEVIVAAGHPVPVPWLTRIFGWSKREAPRMLEGLGSLFEQRKDGIAPFHKSLRDWLTDVRVAGPAFVVDETEGGVRLAGALWTEFLRWAALPERKLLDEFCVAELPAQMLRLRPDESRARLGTVEDWETQKTGLIAVAQAQEKNYDWARALAWWRLTAQLADAMQDFPAHGYALSKAGDILIVMGRTQPALEAFSSTVRIAQYHVQLNPQDLNAQRDLSVFQTKLGDALAFQGDLPASETQYQSAVEIRERLVQTNPAHSGWRVDLASSYRKLGAVLEQQGKRPDALTRFRNAYTIMHELVQAAPDNTEWEFNLYLSANKVGEMFLADGNLMEAQNYLGAGLSAIQRLNAAAPQNLDRQHDLWYSHSKMGELLFAAGDVPQATVFFTHAMEILERLSRHDPGNLMWRNDLATSHDRLASIDAAQGNLPEALASYRVALAITVEVAKSDPDNAAWQSNLAVSQDRVGNVLTQQGSIIEALRHYQEAFSTYHALAGKQPGNAVAQRMLAMSHDRIGALLAKQGETQRALDHMTGGLTIIETLAKADPDNMALQRDLSVRLHRLSRLMAAQNDLDAARAYIRSALNIAKSLTTNDPGDARLQLDMATYKEAFAHILFQQSEVNEGLNQMQDAHEITEWVARCDPDNVDWQHGLALSNANLGSAFGMAGELKRAREHFIAGRNILASLVERRPAYPPWQQELRSLDMQIASLSR